MSWQEKCFGLICNDGINVAGLFLIFFSPPTLKSTLTVCLHGIVDIIGTTLSN